MNSYLDFKSAKKGLDYTRKNRKWILAMGISGLATYGAYRIYHSPAMAERRRRVMDLISSIASLAEMVSQSADSISILSKDFKDFVQSDSDQVPASIRQISKIAKSDEVLESVVRITAAVTAGVLQGHHDHYTSFKTDSGCVDRVMDKLLSDAGSGFASVVVGSFAKNLVSVLCSNDPNNGHPIFYSCLTTSKMHDNGMRRVHNMLCDENCRELIGNCVELFVSTAVTVYLEKTMNVNTFDEVFSALTNPKHEARVRDTLVTLCRCAVETFVTTSHHVLSNQNHRNNGRFLLDLTGKVTFETMRSFQAFAMEKMSESLRRRVEIVHQKEEALEEYVKQKSSASIATFLSLCLHIVNSPWLFVQP